MSLRAVTKHRPGSVAEVATVSLPLMLAVLSTSLMMFADRFVLARYSTTAMNAAVTAGMMCTLFQYLPIGVATIAEVFVGRYHGQGAEQRCGSPVWQMLHFSAFTAVMFWPLALFGGWLLLPQEIEGANSYFRVMMLFAPLYPANAALSAFFIGLGRVRNVTLVTIGANLLNIALDYALVFGLLPGMEPMGTAGAAIGTGVAQVVQLIVMGCLFLQREERQRFGTSVWRFDKEVLWECLRIGTPAALGHVIEIGAWAVKVQMLGRAGAHYLTVMAVGQSFFLLFSFVTEGLQKGVTSLAANYLGAGAPETVKRVARSGILLLIGLVAVLAIPLVLMPEWLVQHFLSDDLVGDTALLAKYCHLACNCVWIYFIFDGIVWALAGILTAAGDTKFVMVMNGMAAWLFALLPIYIAVVILGCSPGWVWVLTLGYAALNAGAFYWRYSIGGWKRATFATV